MKYLRSPTFGWDNIRTRRWEFVAKTQFLCFQFVCQMADTLLFDQKKIKNFEYQNLNQVITYLIHYHFFKIIWRIRKKWMAINYCQLKLSEVGPWGKELLQPVWANQFFSTRQSVYSNDQIQLLNLWEKKIVKSFYMMI